MVLCRFCVGRLWEECVWQDLSAKIWGLWYRSSPSPWDISSGAPWARPTGGPHQDGGWGVHLRHVYQMKTFKNSSLVIIFDFLLDNWILITHFKLCTNYRYCKFIATALYYQWGPLSMCGKKFYNTHTIRSINQKTTPFWYILYKPQYVYKTKLKLWKKMWFSDLRFFHLGTRQQAKQINLIKYTKEWHNWLYRLWK